MNYKRCLVLRWALVLIWLTITAYLSQQSGIKSSATSGIIARLLFRVARHFRPGVSFATFHYLVRKCAHFGMHFVLAWLGYRAFSLFFDKRFYTLVATISLFGLAAVFDELIQSVSPGRAMMLEDAMINVSGVLCGAIVGVLSAALFGVLKRLWAALRRLWGHFLSIPSS